MGVFVFFLFLAVPWFGLWSVIVTFPGHPHFGEGGGGGGFIIQGYNYVREFLL